MSEWSYGTIINTSPYSEDPIGGIQVLRLADNSQLDFYNGDVFHLSLTAFSTASLYGGKFQELRTTQTTFAGDPENPIPNPHIEMFVRDWNFDALTKGLTGTWGDFSAFNIKLIDVQGYSPTIDNIKFTIIPEPISLLLFAAGGMLVWRRK